MLTPLILSDFIATMFEDILYFITAEVFLSKRFEEIKKIFPRIFIFGIVEAFYDAATIQYWDKLNLDSLRIVINLFLFLFLTKIIIQKSWWESIKVNLFINLFAFFSQAVILSNLFYIYGIGVKQVLNNPILLLKVLPIEFLSSIFISLILRKFKLMVISFFANLESLKSSLIKSVFVAIFFQIILLMSLMFDYLDNLSFRQNPLRLLLIMTINLSVVLLSIFILFKTIHKTEKQIVEASGNTMSENFYSLLNSVRGQRHDFINHVQIIKSLFQNEDKEGLNAYLEQLTDDITVLNNVLKVDNPFIGALINSKITKAEIKGIDLKVDISANLANLASKAFDLTRILDNLINNAIEDIEQSNTDEKWIKVIIKEQGPFLSIVVTNPGSPPAEIAEKLFEPGYTSKGREHSGLGLHICNQLSKKLHGKLEHNIIPGVETSFLLVIPKP